jgi:hypothetical protein
VGGIIFRDKGPRFLLEGKLFWAEIEVHCESPI